MARRIGNQKKIEYTVKSEPKLNIDIQNSPDETKTEVVSDAVLNTDIQSSADETKTQLENIPQLDPNIQSSGDEAVIKVGSDYPNLDTNISTSQDIESIQLIKKEIAVESNINVAGDEIVSGSTSIPKLDTDIRSSPDETSITSSSFPKLDIDIQTSSDLQSVQFNKQELSVDTNIQSSGDLPIVIQSPPQNITVDTNIQSSGDLPSIQLAKSEIAISGDIQKSADTQIVRPQLPAQLTPDIQNAPDLPFEFIEFPFNGEWIPQGDPLNIGPNNYSLLKNWRYTDYGFEGVGGHTRINNLNTAITEGINNGIQLYNTINSTSYVIIQDNDATNRDVFYSTTAIPNVETAALTLAYDGTGVGLGRFSLFPNGHMAMCNQNTNVVWAGKRMRIGAFLGNYNDAAGLDYYTHRDDLTDYTNIVRNNVVSDSVTIDDDTAGAIGHTYFIGSPRPLDGFYVGVGTINTAISTMTVNYFDGNDFANNIAITDGTKATNITLEQSGMVQFDADPTVYPYLMCGYYLYFYEVVISAVAGSPTIYNITLDCDMQDAIDIWDSQYRTAILFYTVINSEKKVLTAEMAVSSNSYQPYTANIGGMVNTDPDYAIVMFEEPQAGLKIDMWEDDVNTAVQTINYSYWGEDSAWHSAAPERDSTFDDAVQTDVFAKSGFVLFDRPATKEVATTIDGITGYAYKLIPSTANAMTADTQIDRIQGIPVYRTLNKPYIFPFQYQDRAMWCGSISEDERNRVDYGKAKTEAAFNGEDSSGYFNERSLYFGSGDALTGAAEILYHSSNQPTTSALFFKNSETYILDGYNADTFQIHKLSDDIGCPAPLTIAVSGVIVGRKDAPQRNIAIWMSNSGPMMYYAGIIRPIPGLEPYFERDNSVCIKASLIDEARGWFDSEYNEYNLSFASGTAATINNKWLVLDLTRMKWYEKSPDSNAMFPEGAFPVEDTDGNKYIYGYCASVGYLMRLENGIVWTKTDNTTYDIENEVTTADVLPSKSIWDETQLYYLQAIFRSDDDGDITISYYKDGKTTAETVSTLPTARSIASIDYENAGAVDYRIRHLISYMNLNAWSHRFNFKIANCATATNKPRLLGWGLAYQSRQNSFLDRDELRVITINATHNTLSFTTTVPPGAAVNLDSADNGSYRILDLAEQLETKLNANATLAGSGPLITFTVTVSEGKLNIATTTGMTSIVAAPTNGGAGYTVNDVLTVSEGTDGTVTATTVVAGVVTAVTLTTGGDGYTVGAGKATTGGTGAGCTIEISTIASIAFTQGQDGDTTFGFRTTQGATTSLTADYYPEEEV